jgi:hypothetical protein
LYLLTGFIPIYITKNLLKKGVLFHLLLTPKAKVMNLRRMEFSSPIWDARTSIYKIAIQTRFNLASEPQFIDLSGTSFNIEMPDTSSEELKNIVGEFVRSLIAKDAQAKWFSSRLKETSILKRLSHKWVASDMNPTHTWFIALWTPIYLEVASQGFTLYWQVKRFEESAPQISSRFLAISRPESPTEDATKQITIHPFTAGAELEIAEIPFTNENTAIDFQQQMRDKDALQEARLRLALAKLKANRLSNTYYQKYGEDYTEEGGSSDEGGGSD